MNNIRQLSLVQTVPQKQHFLVLISLCGRVLVCLCVFVPSVLAPLCAFVGTCTFLTVPVGVTMYLVFRVYTCVWVVWVVCQAGSAEDDDLTRSAIKALQVLQERAKAAEGMPLK